MDIDLTPLISAQNTTRFAEMLGPPKSPPLPPPLIPSFLCPWPSLDAVLFVTTSLIWSGTMMSTPRSLLKDICSCKRDLPLLSMHTCLNQPPQALQGRVGCRRSQVLDPLKKAVHCFLRPSPMASTAMFLLIRAPKRLNRSVSARVKCCGSCPVFG